MTTDKDLCKSGTLAEYEATLKQKALEPQIIPKASLRPHIEILNSLAFDTLANELHRLQQKALTDPLTSAEAMKLTKYIDALTRLAREERAQDAESPASALSQEELDLLVPEAHKVLKP